MEAAKQTLQETRVDAVIVSWELPELRGQELVLWIRQQPPRIGRQLVIIAVGNVAPVITSASPVDIFVPRPCNPDELLAFLKRLIIAQKALLLVQESEHVRERMTQWLAPLDFVMTVCADQDEALALLSERSFDCLVLGIFGENGADRRLSETARKQQELHGSWVVLIVPLSNEVPTSWAQDSSWPNAILPIPFGEAILQDMALGRTAGTIPPLCYDYQRLRAQFHRTV
ncbi:DNA-binding response OmpR family regulator [Armatimonas rosea]|uniref:DNA-binding response OmpR family regulator n=1 Tax=Armatimonas rosea TaxID=685828 RepID=A0A7W9SNK3_ARMRO|nr:DNA-binding response OmpR family regulator [Armatimonas rosea]